MSQIDISGLTNVYTDYMNTTAQNATTEKLKSVANADYSNATDEELMGVCKQFESYFLEQVFKEMKKTVPDGGMFKDNSTDNLVDYFTDNALQELATKSTEKNSLGLAQMLYEQMKRNYDL